MQGTIQIHMENLPKGVNMATSADIQGLITQGRTITVTLKIVRNVVEKLLEGKQGKGIDGSE